MPGTVTSRSGGTANILLVEDDIELAREVLADLASRGHAAAHVADGLEALDAIRHGTFDLLVVDRMLPGAGRH